MRFGAIRPGELVQYGFLTPAPYRGQRKKCKYEHKGPQEKPSQLVLH